MMLPTAQLSVYLYNQPVDMRKQFDGLAGLVHQQLQARVTDEALFVFINRKRTLMKVLYYAEGGLCLWCKRLEKGTFHTLEVSDSKVTLTWSQFQCLIGGINWQKMVKNNRISL